MNSMIMKTEWELGGVRDEVEISEAVASVYIWIAFILAK